MDVSIAIENDATAGALFGPSDVNLRVIRAAFGVRLAARDGVIRLSGDSSGVKKAADAIGILQKTLGNKGDLTESDVEEAIASAAQFEGPDEESGLSVLLPGVKIVPKTPGQKAYITAIKENDLTLCLGPAGSGKTYLAVAVAASFLKRKIIDRIVLARPAVEAGEKLCYLPGDLSAKVNPYLRPLFDALNDMMGIDTIRKLIASDVIEVIPLAFMRGRTLNKSVIILDEAQNTTPSQMLMFLTRLGTDSKMIVTGDDSQSDLTPGQRSGVLDAVKRLEGVKRVGVVRLEKTDIFRHPLVKRIVSAYGDTSQ